VSSLTVRTEILNFLNASLPTETVIDLTAEFQDIEDVVDSAGITSDDPWIGVQFVGYDEEAVDILATNDVGCYRELGVITLHVVDIAKSGVHNLILNRAEAIRNILRGRRIGPVVIEGVSPANFGTGITLSFEGGYTSASINVDYKFDRVL
jgi:hypothetical protein